MRPTERTVMQKIKKFVKDHQDIVVGSSMIVVSAVLSAVLIKQIKNLLDMNSVKSADLIKFEDGTTGINVFLKNGFVVPLYDTIIK